MSRALLVVLVGLGGNAAAQRILPHAGARLVEHRVDAGSGAEVTAGPVIGAGVSGRLANRWVVDLDVAGGTLAASAANLDRDLAELRIAAGYHLTSWLDLRVGFLTRTFSARIARQRWTTLYGEAALQLPFAVPGLTGIGRIAFAPVVSVSELPSPGPATTTSAGIRYDLGRLDFTLSYGVERHTFAPQGGSIRREQLSALMLHVAWRP